MNTDSTHATDTDPILVRLRQMILERPSSDTARLKYADRLAGRGGAADVAEAEAIRFQLAHPDPGITISGTEAGIGIARTVIFRRGFIEDIVIAREHVGLVGELLRDHPIGTAWVGSSFLAVAYEIPPEDCDDPTPRPKWMAYVGCPVRHPDGRVDCIVSEWRAWDHRSDLVHEVGPWADGVLPSEPPVEFDCRPPRRQRRSNRS